LGGTLVGPFGNNLMKLVKTGEKDYSVHTLARVQFAPLIFPENNLTENRIISTLPTLMWQPETHCKFPEQFKQAVITVLLMERRKDSDGNPTGLPALLPKHLWFHILSFASRDWFTTPLTRVELLEKLLAQEIKAREEAEKRAAKAEDSRDRLMMAMYLRVQFGTEDNDDDDEMETGATFPIIVPHPRGPRGRGTATSTSSSSSSASTSSTSSSSTSTSLPSTNSTVSSLHSSQSDEDMSF